MIHTLAKKYKEFYQATKPEKPDPCCKTIYQDFFELSDPQNPENPCAKFKNTFHHLIKVIHFEGFVSQFKNGTKANQGKRCDFILCDHQGQTLIFDELTQTKHKYLSPHKQEGLLVKGKQQQALEQLQESVKRLRAVPEIKDHIDMVSHKVLLFSHRDPDYSEDTIGEGARKFSMTVSNKELIKLKESNVKGFETYIQPYPVPFCLK